MSALQSLCIKGVVVQEITLKGHVNAQSQCDYYNGEYDFTPKCREQTVDVEGKHMLSNIKIKEIPTYEVSNESGITITIGD